MTGTDAMLAFADVVIRIAWVAVGVMALVTILTVVRALLRARFSTRKP